MPAHAPAAHARREFVITGFWVTIDTLCWAFALMIAIWGRLDFTLTIFTESSLWIGMLSAAAIHAVVGLLTGPYLVRHMRGSFDEITALTRTALIAALALMAIAWLTPAVFIPRSSALLAPALALVLMLAARFFVRTYRSRMVSRNPHGEKVIVFGAGLAGRRLVHNMLHDDRSQFTPVALLDDDRSKRRLKIEGVPVVGSFAKLAATVEKTGASVTDIAISPLSGSSCGLPSAPRTAPL